MAIASFAAGENIANGQAVYVGENSRLFRASAAELSTARTVGIAIDTAGPGSLVRVNLDGIFVNYTNLTPGEKQYLSINTPGQIVAYSGWLSEFDASSQDAYLQYVGRAVLSSGVEIELAPPVEVLFPIT